MRIMRAGVAALFPLLLAACEDEFRQDWTATPDTVELFSLTRPELIGRASAFDFVPPGVPIAVENPAATGNWDIAIVDNGGTLAFLPASGFTGLSSRAAIAEITASTTLEQLEEAPRDTAAFQYTAVPVRVGRIYVVRTRRADCGFGSLGVRYAKLEALAVSPTAGSVQFRTIVNPYCNNRALIPPD